MADAKVRPMPPDEKSGFCRIRRTGARREAASVMIEKSAGARGFPVSEFIDVNHTGNSMIPLSLTIPKCAREIGIEHRRTSESRH
jgi:hypothetical protein